MGKRKGNGNVRPGKKKLVKNGFGQNNMSVIEKRYNMVDSILVLGDGGRIYDMVYILHIHFN